MSQPIFVIKKSKVKELIEHQSKFTQIPYSLDWGHLKSIEELFEKLDNEPTEHGRIRMHRVYDCIYSFQTHKLIANANRMLDRVFALCKEYRENLNEVKIKSQAVLEKWKPILDFTKNPNNKFATAILIEGQEQWLKPEHLKPL